MCSALANSPRRSEPSAAHCNREVRSMRTCIRASRNERSRTMRRNQVRTGQVIQLAHTRWAITRRHTNEFQMHKIVETIGLPSCPSYAFDKPNNIKRTCRRTPHTYTFQSKGLARMLQHQCCGTDRSSSRCGHYGRGIARWNA